MWFQSSKGGAQNGSLTSDGVVGDINPSSSRQVFGSFTQIYAPGRSSQIPEPGNTSLLCLAAACALALLIRRTPKRKQPPK